MIEFVLVDVFAVDGDDGLAMMIHVSGFIDYRMLKWEASGYRMVVFDRFAMKTSIIFFRVSTTFSHHGEDIAMSGGIQVKRRRLVRLKWNQSAFINVACHSH